MPVCGSGRILPQLTGGRGRRIIEAGDQVPFFAGRETYRVDARRTRKPAFGAPGIGHRLVFEEPVGAVSSAPKI